MHEYAVLLGIDRAARDTLRRMRVTVMARDRLSAAIQAEALADRDLDSPVEYSHTIRVTETMPAPAPVATAMLMLAA